MKKILFSMLSLIVFLPQINAQTVTFNQILELAKNNNKDLKAKKLSIQAAQEDLKQANAAAFGKIVFGENISKTNHAGYVFGSKLAAREANFNDFGFDEFLAKMGGLPNNAADLLSTKPQNLDYPDDRVNFETKIFYQVPIFTGFKIDTAKEMAKLQIAANEAKYNYDEKTMALEVAYAYNGAVAAKYFIKATQKAKEATTSYINLAQELLNEGLATQIDVKEALSVDALVNAKMMEAKNKFDLAIAYLGFLSSQEEIKDVDGFAHFDVIKEKETVDDLRQLQDKAIKNRDDLEWMRLNKETMEKKVEFEKGGEFPMVGLHLEYGFNDDKFSLSEKKDYYMGAIGLEYKIFDGLATSVAHQKAKIEAQKTAYYLEYMREGVELEVKNHFLELKSKESIIQEKQKSVELMEDICEKSKEMYKNNLTNMTNVLMQEGNLQKARAELIFAQYEKAVVAARLKISIGESLGENIK